MFAELDHVLAHLYPTRTWGEPDDLARFGAGIGEDEGQALAEELARALDASTFYRAGDDDEYCDYIYILCLGREPCLVQLRDGQVPLPEELTQTGATPTGTLAAPSVDEMYLRLCLSHMARLAGVQQVAMTLDGAPSPGNDPELLIYERPRAGVYDAPLLRRMQRLVAILPAYDITHIDFGEISAPPVDFLPGRYADLYGGAPHTANYLFYPQPSTMETTSLLPSNEIGERALAAPVE